MSKKTKEYIISFKIESDVNEPSLESKEVLGILNTSKDLILDTSYKFTKITKNIYVMKVRCSIEGIQNVTHPAIVSIVPNFRIRTYGG